VLSNQVQARVLRENYHLCIRTARNADILQRCKLCCNAQKSNCKLTSELSQSSTRMNVSVSRATSSSDSLISDVADVFGGYSNFKLLHLLTAAACCCCSVCARKTQDAYVRLLVGCSQLARKNAVFGRIYYAILCCSDDASLLTKYSYTHTVRKQASSCKTITNTIRRTTLARTLGHYHRLSQL
jgi:hypothetical protein